MAASPDPRTGLPVVAMVGGGQLSRMTHQAAIALGQSVRVLATDPAESAALVAADVQIGDHRDLTALQRLAGGAAAGRTAPPGPPPPPGGRAGGAPAVPSAPGPGRPGPPRPPGAAGPGAARGPAALVHAQDKLVLRRALAEAGEPQPAWA